MLRKKISQRAARQLFHKVRRLEEYIEKQRRDWSQEYPGGVYLGSFAANNVEFTQVKTARRLGYAVVVTYGNANVLEFYALPLEKVCEI